MPRGVYPEADPSVAELVLSQILRHFVPQDDKKKALPQDDRRRRARNDTGCKYVFSWFHLVADQSEHLFVMGDGDCYALDIVILAWVIIGVEL